MNVRKFYLPDHIRNSAVLRFSARTEQGLYICRYLLRDSAMSAIGPIGFRIAIVQARTILSSIKHRIDNYRKGPGTFEELGANVDRLKRHFDEMETLLKTFPSAVPSEISTTFFETFAAVRGTLESTDASFSIAIAGGSSVMGKIKSKALRTFQATSLSDEIN